MFLATVTHATTRDLGDTGNFTAGPYAWTEWVEGREKWRKYEAQYAFEREEGREDMEPQLGAENYSHETERYLVFHSLFGNVPGYKAGDPTPDSPVTVHMVLDMGEWRVKDATVRGIPSLVAPEVDQEEGA